MKRWSKILIVSALVLALCTIFGISIFASDEAVEQPAFTLEDIEFKFVYTSDSVVSEGMRVQTYTDPISQQSGVELIPDFGFGYTVYDDPETEIIDGIRINNAEVTSLRIPMSAESFETVYTVAVRTVYVDGASGDLAQIFDGTFDYSRLLTNPVILFQVAYWIILIITAIAGLVAAIRNKSKRVKTSDEIADKVSERSDERDQHIIDVITGVVKAEILPLAQASVDSGKNAVKAIVLSNSKSKEAPAALLDVFKDSSELDVKDVVDDVRKNVEQFIKQQEAEHAEKAAMLHDIANHVIQEDVSDAKQSTEQASTASPYKSIF